MGYTLSEFKSAVREFGEVFVVLESDREYVIHGEEGYDIVNNGNSVRTEGMQDGEYIIGVFPLDAIEHHYTHKEV